jgi:EmrB/QacA subfamily drug resistance transporter
MEQKKRSTVLAVLFIGVLMGALDIAIVGPALPSIRSQLNVSDRSLPWMFSIYVLFSLIGTPLMAKLSDQFGRRTIYILDVALFAAGSLVVALSPSFAFVLVGRAIQGFGSGGIFPVASAVIGDTFPPEKRGGALGLIGAVFGLAFLVGPLLGALILGLASWHWLFFINLPIALVVIGLSLRTLPSGRPAQNKSFDWLGMLVLAVLLFSLAWSINHLDTHDLLTSLVSLNVLPFVVMFVALIFVLVQVERKAENPIVPLGLFDRTQLRLTYALTAGAGLGEASLVFISLLAVVTLNQYGINEKNSSWMLMPVVLAMAFGSPMAGRLLDRFGSRTVIITGTVVMSAGMLMLGLSGGNMALFITACVLIGLGMSALLGAPMRYIMLNESRPSERSVAQGVLAVFASAGQLIGSTLTGAIAASRAVVSGEAAGYSLAFVVIGVFSLVLVVLAFLLKKRADELATIQENEAAHQDAKAAQRESQSAQGVVRR